MVDSSTATPESGSVTDVLAYQTIQKRFAPLRVLGDFERAMDKRFGVESQGIDRIAEDARRPPSLANAVLLWYSMNLHVGSLPVGFLGPELGLPLGMSIAAIVVGVFTGAFLPAFCSILAPKLGLRAIATSRYSFGFWGAKLCGLINVLVNIGFGVISSVVAGQLINAVSDFTVSISVGCVIICLLSFVVSLFGFRVIHTVEKYSWILAFILSLVLVVQAAPQIDPAAPSPWSGTALAGAFLIFFAAAFAYASAWCTVAGDYYVNYRAETSPWTIFSLSYFGITIPTTFILIIGACVGQATFNYAPWTEVYEAHGFGAVLGAIYHPSGWSKFALVMSMFTTVGTVSATFYSCSLSCQALGHYFHAVPRFVWALVAFAANVALSVAGQEHLSDLLLDFCNLLSYWTVSFTVILFLEHVWFRRGGVGYDVDAWDSPSRLPPGVAAVVSLLVGYCAGGIPGMDQTWFVGPIAKMFGGPGGDVGVFLSLVFTLISYMALRTLEKRFSGR
ncbi:permease for cytosine/purines, uracil, thiamine, allantoin-domain-containing protein [Xylariales sp. PMI_506]|nr:permease for cytosine/purines, uracil, thiamine, allantoin-domain-containing protein [Xylariales sp. PMI_506]